MSDLSPKAQELYAVLCKSPAAREPTPRSAKTRYILFGIPTLMVALVALGIGFQFDPFHLGPGGLSKFISAPFGVLIAVGATAFYWAQVSWIHEHPREYFMPGEQKILLTSRERNEYLQLRMDHSDADSAIGVWLSEGHTFGANHLRAVMHTCGLTTTDLDKNRLRAAWRLNLRFGLLVAAGFATVDACVYHFMPATWPEVWSQITMQLIVVAFMGLPFVEIFHYLTNKRRHEAKAANKKNASEGDRSVAGVHYFLPRSRT